MTTRNKRKLAALNRGNCDENPRINVAQNSGAPLSQEDYITQVSEETEGRVTKRLSKEFSRTEDRILGALARLVNFLMNPLLPGHSGTTPEPTRNTSHNNQGTNEDDSQNDPYPEAGPFYGQTSRNVSLEEDHDTKLNFLSLICQSFPDYWRNVTKKFSLTIYYFMVVVLKFLNSFFLKDFENGAIFVSSDDICQVEVLYLATRSSNKFCFV